MGQKLMKHNRLLEHLLKLGLIGETELRSAAVQQQDTGGEIIDVLLDAKLIREVDLARGLASFFRFPLVNLRRVRVSKQALEQASGAFCRRHQLMPFGFDPNSGDLLVAVSGPAQITAVDALRFRCGQNVKPYVAPRTQLHDAIEFYYFQQSDGTEQPSPSGVLKRRARTNGGAHSIELGIDPAGLEGTGTNPSFAGLQTGDITNPPDSGSIHADGAPDTGAGTGRSGLGTLNPFGPPTASKVTRDLNGRIKNLEETVLRLERALRYEIRVTQSMAEILVESGLISSEQLKSRLRRRRE